LVAIVKLKKKIGFRTMLQFETLIAFGIGAGLVALAPVVGFIAGKGSNLATSVGFAGRNLTKKGLKIGLKVTDRAGSAVRSIGNSFSEVGESFSDILAEAKADLAQPKAPIGYIVGKD
jgi:hypothetical protein